MAHQITRHTWLYSEVMHAGTVIHSDKNHFLRFNEGEQPVALQLGRQRVGCFGAGGQSWRGLRLQ
ncbi:hypothetical protein [Neisseria musculi]|uniref:hypothetical protein n=1 Tax=Neisseria musculi TaxID=1815583 RepID=UPI0031B62D15